MRARAAIFDLDGTLVDSLGDIADSMNWALARIGRPGWREEDYRRFVGEGVAALARRALGEDGGPVEELLAHYRARYAERMLARTRPYAGVVEVLDALAARGLALGVLSNKPDGPTRRMVEALFGARFAAVAGEVPGTPRKPDPAGALAIATELGAAAAACVFVGDTAIDMQTAARAGMAGVGVTWGFRGRGELEAAGARAIVDRPDELLALVEFGA